MSRVLRRTVLLIGGGLLFFTGCLPYSCQREPNEALFPADSVSRRVAQDAPVDTLQSIARSKGTEDHPLTYPRTVRFTHEEGLAVSDAKRNSLFRFRRDGTFRREVQDTAFAVPYLIGTREDTLVVFNAGADRVDFVVEGRRLSGQAVSYERPAPETLVYMLAADTALYAKVVGQNTGSQIARLDETGEVTARTTFDGPYWRSAGFLRAWGDSVLSLSGFRPLVHHLPRGFGQGAPADSFSLVGFDSPMLERSFAYASGDVDKPPLLSASAAPVGDTLFVLNLRPGWVQIDAYDRSGRLQHRLVERHDGGDRNFYPTDLDVRRTAEAYRFAVTVRSPNPQLELFRWRPENISEETASLAP